MEFMRREPGDERESAIQSGWTVEGRHDTVEPEPTELEAAETHIDADAAGDLVDGEGDQPQQMSNLTVVLLGLVGGISLLYAWVWMSWAQYYSTVNASVAASSGSIGGVLQQVVFWIAPLAPVLWFISALVMQRRNARRLTIALILGLIVTFPLPMVFASGAAL